MRREFDYLKRKGRINRVKNKRNTTFFVGTFELVPENKLTNVAQAPCAEICELRSNIYRKQRLKLFKSIKIIFFRSYRPI